MSYFRFCEECGASTAIRYITDKAICSECAKQIDENIIEKKEKEKKRMENKLTIYKTIAENCKYFGYDFNSVLNNDKVPTSILTWANTADNGWERLVAYLNPATTNMVEISDNIA